MKAHNDIKKDVHTFSATLDMHTTVHDFTGETWVEVGTVNDNIPACVSAIRHMLASKGVESRVHGDTGRFLIVHH